MQVQILPKSTTRRRGLAYGRNASFAPGQPVVILINGIGEYNDETNNATTGIPRNCNHGMWDRFKREADLHKYNLVWTNSQRNAHDTTDEIDYAIEMAIKDLQCNPRHIILYGYSWGGRRIEVWFFRGTPGAHANKILAAVRIAPGTSNYAAAANIQASDTPVLQFHAKLDPVAAEEESANLFIDVKKLEPDYPIQYCEFAPDGNTSDDHGIHSITCKGTITGTERTILNSAFNRAPTGVPAYTTPRMTLWQWWDMLIRFGPHVKISDTYIPVSGPVPVPEPVPVPPSQKVTVTSISTSKLPAGSTVAIVGYSDGTSSQIKPASGDDIVYTRSARLILGGVNYMLGTIKFKVAAQQTVGPNKPTAMAKKAKAKVRQEMVVYQQEMKKLARKRLAKKKR
jgi:predicted esterase